MGIGTIVHCGKPVWSNEWKGIPLSLGKFQVSMVAEDWQTPRGPVFFSSNSNSSNIYSPGSNQPRFYQSWATVTFGEKKRWHIHESEAEPLWTLWIISAGAKIIQNPEKTEGLPRISTWQWHGPVLWPHCEANPAACGRCKQAIGDLFFTVLRADKNALIQPRWPGALLQPRVPAKRLEGAESIHWTHIGHEVNAMSRWSVVCSYFLTTVPWFGWRFGSDPFLLRYFPHRISSSTNPKCQTSVRLPGEAQGRLPSIFWVVGPWVAL